MRSVLRTIRQFLSELRRRNVYQVAVTYVIVGVFVIEAADLTLTRLGLPPWTVTLVIVLVGLGFPIALVLAWALEMTPEGVRVEEPEGSEETAPAPASSPRDLWVGGSVLALLLLGAWWVWGGLGEEGGAGQTEREAPKIQDRSIAVLPFEVSGSGAEEWRDGMVTMLSAGLDGAAGLRAVADRTIFARWEEAVGPEEGATRTEALSVARTIGARYAVVGTAGVLGEDLRLLADVYETGSGNRLGQAQVRGSPEEVMALTDALTREVLGILLEKSEDRVPSVDLASITTASLPALKAYLRGERHFRAGQYEAAVEDFEAAIREDSSFALAYMRSGRAHFWLPDLQTMARKFEEAYQRSEKLPLRERRIVWAQHAHVVEGRSMTAADSLRTLTSVYPDDPTVWYDLGEVLFHGNVPRGWVEAEGAFEKAIELDPEVAPYHSHFVDLAFSLHRDSTLAAERMAAHPSDPVRRQFRAVLDLVFGTPEQKQAAFGRLDSILTEGAYSPIHFSLEHPIDGALRLKVLRALSEQEENPALGGIMGGIMMERGQLSDGLAQLETAASPAGVSCELAWGLTLGFPVSDSLLTRYLEPSELRDDDSSYRIACTGISLVERGRGSELDSVLDRLRSAAASSGDSTRIKRLIRSLKGYRAWKSGRLKRAERLWAGYNDMSFFGAIWRGDLYRKLGDLEKAEGWYQAAWRHPVTHERLGQLYEKMGRPKKAAAAYERFTEAWDDADPELQDRVETARERLEALRTEQAAE